jgi:glycerol-3-phosphate dehydrogenase
MDEHDECPLLSVFGGKITTHRHLAEVALNKLKKYFPRMKSSWTDKVPLPGGDIPNSDFKMFVESLNQEYYNLNPSLIKRYASQFGTRIHNLLKHSNNPIILGENVGGELYQCEVEYLVNHEWAQTIDDILWRRTKLGFSFPNDKLCSLQKIIPKIFNKNI